MNLEESRRLYGEPRIGDSVAHTSFDLKGRKAIITNWFSSGTRCNIRYVDNKAIGFWYKRYTYTVSRPGVEMPPPISVPPSAMPRCPPPLTGINEAERYASEILKRVGDKEVWSHTKINILKQSENNMQFLQIEKILMVNGVNVLKANAEVLLNSISVCQVKVKELTDLGITSTRVDEEIKKVEKTIAKLVKLLDAS